MATEIEIKVAIEAAAASKDIGGLRKSLKDLVSAQEQVGAGSKNFEKLRSAINQTEGRLGDLTDSFQTLRGSGVERLNASFGLLKEGFLGADPGKLKIGLQGLGAAMSAIPIFLLIEGLNFLVNNFDEVVKVVKSAIGVVDQEAEAQKRLNKELQETNLQLKELDSTYKYYSANRQQSLDLEIEKLKQRGASQKEIDAAIIKSEEDKLVKLKQIRDEATELGVADLFKYQNAVNEQQDAIALTIAKTNTDSVERAREATEKKIKLAQQEADEIEKIRQSSEKRNQDAIKRGQEIIDAGNKEVDDRERKEREDAINEQIKIAQDFKAKNAEFDKDEAKVRREENEKLSQNIKDLKDDELKKSKEVAKQKQEAEIQGAVLTVNAVQSISDLVFQIKSNNIKKGSAEELKAAKQQFNINKGLQIAQATIQGIQAVQAAFSSGSAIPVVGAVTGPAFALAAGIASAANIAKIASIKFDGGGSGVDTQQASFSSISSPAPSISSPAFQSQNNGFNPSGNLTGASQPAVNGNAGGRVGVLESDIRKVVTRVEVYENESEFG